MSEKTKERLIYVLLLFIKGFGRTFYRFNVSWIGKIPKDPWKNLRLVVFLNHTSLFEPIFAGWVPTQFLKRVAKKGVVPIADKTMRRPLAGRFFKLVARKVVTISRRRDYTWERFVNKISPDSLVFILPEGRMKRANGLDAEGKPMTVRGGVADLLRAIPGGRMIIAYSGGLHHVQVPSQRFPKLFKTLQMRIESVDISRYTRHLLEHNGMENFKKAVARDLESRLDLYCTS
mgnify:FL=1